MATPPDIKRLVREDFSDENQMIIDKIAFSLNPFMEQVVSALTKNINIDNLAQEIKTFNVTTNSTTGVPNQEISFTTSLTSSIQGIQCIRADNQTRPDVYVTTAPFVSFTTNGRQITINNITGLAASASPPTSDEFRIVLLIIT